MFFSQEEQDYLLYLVFICFLSYKVFTVKSCKLLGNWGGGGKGDDVNRKSPRRPDHPITECLVQPMRPLKDPAYVERTSGGYRLRSETQLIPSMVVCSCSWPFISAEEVVFCGAVCCSSESCALRAVCCANKENWYWAVYFYCEQIKC